MPEREPRVPTARDGDRVDWVAAEQSPEFKELIAKKRRFVLPATIFFLSWYFGFILLAGYAPSFMGESIYEGFTVGYALALSQFVMVWVLSYMYLKRADRNFDPLADKAARTAFEAGEREGRAMTLLAADVRVEALAIFAVVVAITLFVTYLASKRMTSATDFWAAGRGIAGAPERVRDRGRLHVRGVVPRHRRPDLPVRLRRLPLLGRLPGRVPSPCSSCSPSGCAGSGNHTIADVCRSGSTREPARSAALGTLAVAGFYLIAQMVGAGVPDRGARWGSPSSLSVLITGAFMLIYVIDGRDARHHLGADHQGGAADGGRHRAPRSSCSWR